MAFAGMCSSKLKLRFLLACTPTSEHTSATLRSSFGRSSAGPPVSR